MTQSAPGASGRGARDFTTMLTWRGLGTDRLEQVRLYVSGARVKAYGRIISAANDQQDAFSASYELITNERGLTKRLSVHLLRADGESHFGVARDEENQWLIERGGETTRQNFGAAADVDLAMSPMFNALPLRRNAPDDTGLDVPVVYVDLPGGDVEPAILHYRRDAAGIHVTSPMSESRITLDDNGFVLDYSGLATRV